MGWKTFKEKFNIEHKVQIRSGYLLIGSDYVSDLVTIEMDSGFVSSNSAFPRFINENYPELYHATTEEILEALRENDVFEKSLKVYTYKGSRIVEEYCEEFGYPNTTHSGNIMHENTYFKSRRSAVREAQKNNKHELEYVNRKIKEMKKEITELQERAQRITLDKEALEEELTKE